MDGELDFHTLVERSSAGEAYAFEQIYTLTIDQIYQMIYFLIDKKEDVNDLTQEVYIQMYNSLENYDNNRPFKAWLNGIAIRVVHSYRRSRWRSQRIANRALEQKQIHEGDFTGALIEKLESRKLIDRINCLPFKQKEAVILHYLNEYSYEEVARILGIPVGTVKSRLHSALISLRRQQKVGSPPMRGGI